jgi:hypothetical protein
LLLLSKPAIEGIESQPRAKTVCIQSQSYLQLTKKGENICGRKEKVVIVRSQMWLRDSRSNCHRPSSNHSRPTAFFMATIPIWPPRGMTVAVKNQQKHRITVESRSGRQRNTQLLTSLHSNLGSGRGRCRGRVEEGIKPGQDSKQTARIAGGHLSELLALAELRTKSEAS